MDLLNYLRKEKNTDIRKLTFLVAQDTTGDYTSFYFNTLHTQSITEKELQTAKDRSIEEETNYLLRYLFTKSSG